MEQSPTQPLDHGRLWRLVDVAVFLGVSERTARRLTVTGGFPPPVPLTPTVKRWRPVDVVSWIDSRATQPTPHPDRAEARPSRPVDAWR